MSEASERRCETCRYWSPLPFEEIEGYFESDHPVHEGSWGQCRMIRQSDGAYTERHPDTDAARSERAFTSDASGYHSWFTTRADFGCIEHAPAASLSRDKK